MILDGRVTGKPLIEYSESWDNIQNLTDVVKGMFAYDTTNDRFVKYDGNTWSIVGITELPGSFSGFDNPSSYVGLTFTNGVSTYAMRSDASPALDQNISPIWTGLHLFNQTSLSIKGATSVSLTLKPNETLTINRTLNIVVGDSDRTLTFGGDATISGSNTGDQTISLTGDVTGSGTGSFATTIGSNKVTDGMIRQSSALSLIGRSANSIGNVADISTAASSDAVLRESGGVIGFGTIAAGGIASGAVTAAKLANASAQYKYLVSGATPFSYAESVGGLNIATGKIPVFNNTITFSGTDGTTMTFPSTSGTVAIIGIDNLFTSNQTINNTAPTLTLTDTTASAKSLTITVDGNKAQLRESAGAAGSLLVLDLANNRIGVGVASPLTSIQSASGMILGTGGSSTGAWIFPFSGSTFSTPDATGRGLTFYTYASSSTNTFGLAFTGDTATHTSGIVKNFLISRSFSPTSGTATFANLEMGGSVNQTGGASGIARWLYINLTSITAADFRALEIGNVGGTQKAILTGTGLVSFGDQVSVTGSQDIIQLSITGHTTQTQGTGLVKFIRNDTAAGLSHVLDLTTLGSGAANDGGYITMNGKSSTTAAQSMGRLRWYWSTATHASRQAYLVLSAYDTAERDLITIGGNGSAGILGFYGVTPVARPSAYTQTYSTADKTHANFTSSDLTGITSSTTGSALVEPSASYTQSEMQQNFRRIQDQFVNLRADVADLKQLVNSVIDDLQALGLAQ